jgi:hypothetical protein
MRAILLREIGEVVIAEQKMEKASSGNRFIYDDYSEKITAVAASMVKMEILHEDWDGRKYYIRAKIKIDPSEVSKKANEVLLNHKEMKTLQEKNQQVLQEVEKLNREIAGMKIKMQKSEDFLFSEINDYKMQINDYLGQIMLLKQTVSANLAKYSTDLSKKDSVINYLNSTYSADSLRKDSIINYLNSMLAELKTMKNDISQNSKSVDKEIIIDRQGADEITIATTPSNALIYINNKYIGKTPYTYKNAPHGKMEIRAKLLGYESQVWNISYYGGKMYLNKKF